MPRLTLLLLASLAACATMGTAPAGLAGTYTTTIAEGDIPASAPADMRTGMAGAWEMTLDGSGHAVVRYNGRQVVDAPYTMNGSELTFTDDTGEYACHSPARYTWNVSGGQLRFTRIEDSCEGRVLALTAHPWAARP